MGCTTSHSKVRLETCLLASATVDKGHLWYPQAGNPINNMTDTSRLVDGWEEVDHIVHHCTEIARADQISTDTNDINLQSTLG